MIGIKNRILPQSSNLQDKLHLNCTEQHDQSMSKSLHIYKSISILQGEPITYIIKHTLLDKYHGKVK